VLLRRITEHVKAQNWFAVGLDFLIVVAGVFIGLQVQQWALERERLQNENEYLTRLHGEAEQLMETRIRYDGTRVLFSSALIASVNLLHEKSEGAVLTFEQCTSIASSAHLTVPPADLPTVTELLSAGRLDQLNSPPVRTSILNFVQDVAGARDLILALGGSSRDLGKSYPDYITHHLGPSPYQPNAVWLNPSCRAEAMQSDARFMNELSENAYVYSVYTDRAVLPVSRRLAELHDVLDAELGIKHAKEIE